MASTYSTNLAFELMGTGDQSGTWGNTTNTNVGTLIEQAISGYVTQAITDGADTTITIPNGATGVARNMYIEMNGTITATRNMVVPANRKLYYIYNNTVGGFAVTVKVSGQTGVSVPNGKRMTLVCNGTDVIESINYHATIAAGAFNGPLTGAVTGNASTATTFQTARNINGVSFNGSADITVAAAAGTLTGSSLAAGVTGSSLTSIGTLVAGSIPGTLITGTVSSASSASTATSVSQSLTFSSGGAGDAATSTYNGGTARTISYNSIGAPSTTGANASGSWGINITGSSASCSGNAATVTNGVYTTNIGSTVPSPTGTGASGTWSINITGSAGSASSATTASTANALNAANSYTVASLTAGTLNATSDQNYKTNIQTIKDATSLVKVLNGVRFNWRDTGLPSAGLIAQDVQVFLPELVTKENEKLALNYNGLVGVLVQAIKELSARVEYLEAR